MNVRLSFSSFAFYFIFFGSFILLLKQATVFILMPEAVLQIDIGAFIKGIVKSFAASLIITTSLHAREFWKSRKNNALT